MHGTFILQLKEKWPCETHQGEHGEPGFCYVDPNSRHIGLNNRKLKTWAAAIVGLSETMWVYVADLLIGCS